MGDNAMKKLRAFKFKLKANSNQQTMMARFAGCGRYVYNKALAEQKQRMERKEGVRNYATQCRALTEWRHANESAFLAEAPTHPLQQCLKDLSRAFSNFFSGRAKFPRFKKKGRGDSFRYPDPKQIKFDGKNSRIFLPKLGWMRYRKSREIAGTIKQVTVSRAGDGWFISIQTEQETTVHQRSEGSAIGIDLGVATFATLSDGTTYQPEIDYKTYQNKIAREQRILARKQKYSNNWRKEARRVQQMYRRVRNSRLDFQHKTSTTICKNHATVIVEDLNVKGMSASAAGTLENPGKNVRAKSGLNRSILNQGWFEFRRQLQYKLEEVGGLLVCVPAKHTSAKCSKCGFTSKENRKSQSKFLCLGCSHAENADLNAARNILAAGLAVLACGETPIGISLKQEPTVAARVLA
jgi:putative transposase